MICLHCLRSRQTRLWDLGDGTTITVLLPDKISKRNIDKLKKYVSVLEFEASIAWEDSPPLASTTTTTKAGTE